ncbi:starch phosphorylase [Paenibacillus shirakamiensis]|uniref:Alpha-1,4 glucan phosphorylase n=1 Tax=Paenibacillus shirakamiensis TaxID=1265935 RepID=A0ABS4JGS2_9BACL|nr:glycogen/starch/alpha-glucan phosphorylase [Paenibacillus shirakamiensis]MBP2000919.1 starch phosphorylase [Paenibacillus shirakamiensis]
MFTDKDSFKKVFSESLIGELGRPLEEATGADVYKILSGLIREYAGKDWAATNQNYKLQQEKQVYYFSMEFLIGRLLGSNLLNLGILDMVREGLSELGWNLEEIEEQESDAGLGNGGLGRLAACFLDSLASRQYAGHGCGIRYKYGLFEQKIIDGDQVELPDYWLQKGNEWEVRRADKSVEVRFWGRVDTRYEEGRWVFETQDYEAVSAVPYDVPVIGYGHHHVNTLRLWSAESTMITRKNVASKHDDYYKFLSYNRSVESISEFLYPDDSQYEGKLLRLKQQYFLCSAGLQSILRTFEKLGLPYTSLPDKIALHINDTHPTLLIPELMRILIDEQQMSWDEAWDITNRTVSYTNHTTLSEALEKWPTSMVKDLLPRVFMIIEEIDRRFCSLLLAEDPSNTDRVSHMAILGNDQVRMAHLAIVGSYSVNGVAALHTEILKKREMKSFYDQFPERFNNKTNGITHRRWLIHANPKLKQLISSTIGDKWITEPTDLLRLQDYASDSGFQTQIHQIKQHNKINLAAYIEEKNGVKVDPNSIFDVQVKRLHGYKRQLLNVLHIIHLYHEIRENPSMDRVPRTFIFGAKAAPSYYLAKRVIKLINVVADVVNNDPLVNDKMKVVFLENYSVSLAEKIIPAADLSEQISTASKEASGTGNMKFMMNGALTIGTMDGANVEMHESLGDDNMFIFGLRSDEVLDYYQHGGYDARAIYHQDPRVQRVLEDLVQEGPFSSAHRDFALIYDSILNHNDEYFVLKDFDSYVSTQLQVEQTYLDRAAWLNKSIMNIAHAGRFASDFTIDQYASEIWRIRPVHELIMK